MTHRWRDTHPTITLKGNAFGVLSLSHVRVGHRRLSSKTEKSLLTLVNRDYRIRRLAMTYSHMGKPHTTIGATAFHC